MYKTEYNMLFLENKVVIASHHLVFDHCLIRAHAAILYSSYTTAISQHWQYNSHIILFIQVQFYYSSYNPHQLLFFLSLEFNMAEVQYVMLPQNVNTQRLQ